MDIFFGNPPLLLCCCIVLIMLLMIKLREREREREFEHTHTPRREREKSEIFMSSPPNHYLRERKNDDEKHPSSYSSYTATLLEYSIVERERERDLQKVQLHESQQLRYKISLTTVFFKVFCVFHLDRRFYDILKNSL